MIIRLDRRIIFLRWSGKDESRLFVDSNIRVFQSGMISFEGRL
jgi:hypothetical protein